jgi:hypothetical protein
MNPHGNRTRLAGVLVAVAAVLALVALPGIASAHHDHDSLADAGTIQSFDPANGVLAIDLTEGGSVSGLVTPRTHIHCDNGRHRGRHGLRHHLRHDATASHDRGGEGEDNRGRGEEESGDDHGEGVEPGENNHENGDDPPGHDGTAPGNSEGPGRGDDRSARCSTDDLIAGTTVKFAVLTLVDGKAIYSVVGLPEPEEGEPDTPPTP